MKIALFNLVLILTFIFPASLWAQELESWLKNVKREVTQLGISERGYLHSINHLRNSVVQDEDLFFISSMQFEELDIQLFPDGSARVEKASAQRGNNVDSKIKNRTGQRQTESCESNLGEKPRISLSSVSLKNNYKHIGIGSDQKNLIGSVDHFVADLLLAQENIALSPFFDDHSRYENLIRGSHFEDSKHKLLYMVEYSESTEGAGTWWNEVNPRRLFKKVSAAQSIKVSLMIVDGEVIRKRSDTHYDLSDTDIKSIKGVAQSADTNKFLQKVTGDVSDFLSTAHCVITHSNSVVASKGALILEAGVDAGLSEGDQLLIMPRSKYFKKRGLLSGVNRIAIARISEISALRSVLEIEEGSVDLGDGAEYFARPLLELI